MSLSPESEVILRHKEDLQSSHIVIAGGLSDDLPRYLDAQAIKVHCHQFHYWLQLEKIMGENAKFGLLPDPVWVEACDTIIYFWSKSKAESQFQLASLLSQIKQGTTVFIVGENRSGVRSAEALLSDFGDIQKVDTARRCSLYRFIPSCRVAFDLDEWWSSYTHEEVKVRLLPGVFSHDGLDLGSQLLLSVLAESLPANFKGTILDIGCGSGVLASKVGQLCPQATLTLSDVSAAALASSEETLGVNNLQGNVVASNVFSHISGRFDVIISNPPFHDGRDKNLHAAQQLILGAKQHLQLNGHLYIVANAFLPYPELLAQTFGQFEEVAQTGKFKVYKAKLRAPKGVTSLRRKI